MSASSASGPPAAFLSPQLAPCLPPAALSGSMFGTPMSLPLAASVALAPPVPLSSTEAGPDITLAAGLGALPPPPPLPVHAPAATMPPAPLAAVPAASVAAPPPVAPVAPLPPPPTLTVTLPPPPPPHVATGSAGLTLAATQPTAPSAPGSLPDVWHQNVVVDNGDLKLVGQLTKTVGMFDLRMSDNVPRTKVSAWLNRWESALELHFGPLGEVSCERLLRVVLQIVDDRTKTFVQTTLSAGATWMILSLP